MLKTKGASGKEAAQARPASWLVEDSRSLQAKTESAAYAMGAAAPAGDANAWAPDASEPRSKQPGFLIQS